MKPLLLTVLLLLCSGSLASSAWADPLPLLPGSTWDLFQNHSIVMLITSQFTAGGNDDSPTFGFFQGMSYCTDSGHLCGAPGTPATFGLVWGPLMATLPHRDPFDFSPVTVPATLTGSVGFFVIDHFVGFTFEGMGTATSVDGHSIYHADFGSALQTPEPATWLLLLSGMILIGSSRWSRSRV